MIVYRIQSKQDRTRGSYHSAKYDVGDGSMIDQMHFEHSHSANNIDIHPAVYEDIKRDMKHNEYSGCATAADLLRWFKGFIPDLLQAGCEIVALRDVTITAVGEYQVLFKWND